MPPVPRHQMYSDIPNVDTSWLTPKSAMMYVEAKDHTDEIEVMHTEVIETKITTSHLCV